MKKLFERILKLVELLESNSQTAFAKRIGCQQSTFNGYMNEEGQRKIRLTLLEDILKVYSQISRDWLYFGEGSMFKDGTSGAEPLCPTPPAPEAVPAKDPHVQELERENAELNVELRGALKEIRRLNEEKRELEERLKCAPGLQDKRLDNPQHATTASPVTGAPERGM